MLLEEASNNCSNCIHCNVCSYKISRAIICDKIREIKDIDCGNLFGIVVECKEFKYKGEMNVKELV